MYSTSIIMGHSSCRQLQNATEMLCKQGIAISTTPEITAVSGMAPDGQPVLAVLAIDRRQYQAYVLSGMLRNLTGLPDLTLFLFVTDPSLAPIVSAHWSGKAILIAPGTTAEDIAAILLLHCRRAGMEPQPESAPAGEIGDVAVNDLLDYSVSREFNGSIRFDTPQGNALVGFRHGRIETINYQTLAGMAALVELLEVRQGCFRLEESRHSLQDIYEYMQGRPRADTMQAQDVLIDIFYFMHRHLETRYALPGLEKTIRAAIETQCYASLNEVSIIYSLQLHEKLHLLGNIGIDQIDSLLNLFEEIYNSLSGGDDPWDFAEFLLSLEEIRPYILNLESLCDISPAMSLSAPFHSGPSVEGNSVLVLDSTLTPV